MKTYLVRVTRSTDDEYADVEVEAASADHAKAEAVLLVRSDPGAFFGDEAVPYYFVAPEDGEPEEGSDQDWYSGPQMDEIARGETR